MATTRKEFSNRDKARIFKRDRATCAFTGKCLWIFDHGASPLWDTDWVDHIRPSSRKGTNLIENGVCASSAANSKKSNNTRDCAYWFWHGIPTEHYFHAVGSVPTQITAQLRRLRQLHESDWYLNRAAKNLLMAVQQTAWPERKKRTPDYWCKAALKMVNAWKLAASDVQSLEDRKVLLMPLDPDQHLLLQLRDCKSISDIHKIKRELVPYRKANWRAYDRLLKFLSSPEKYQITEVLIAAEADADVSPRFLKWLKATTKALKDIHVKPDPKTESLPSNPPGTSHGT